MAGISITEVSDGASLEVVRELCRAFRRGQYDRYADQIERIEGPYGEAAFEKTLAALAELHAPPQGAILLAHMAGKPVGCVMLSCISEETCEMKRMFVDNEMRRMGAGRLLCAGVIDAARARGYARMRLDTGPLQHEAVTLYRSFGFEPCEPYEEDGPKWPDKVFMVLKLKEAMKGEA